MLPEVHKVLELLEAGFRQLRVLDRRGVGRNVSIAGDNDLAERRHEIGHPIVLVIGRRFELIAQTKVQR